MQSQTQKPKERRNPNVYRHTRTNYYKDKDLHVPYEQRVPESWIDSLCKLKEYRLVTFESLSKYLGCSKYVVPNILHKRRFCSKAFFEIIVDAIYALSPDMDD